MKKQIKDCTEDEFETIIDSPKVLELIGLYYVWGNRKDMNFSDMYDVVCKVKDILEEEIELEDNKD